MAELSGTQQCSKWDGMKRYAIPVLLVTGKKHTATSLGEKAIPGWSISIPVYCFAAIPTFQPIHTNASDAANAVDK